MKKKLLLLSLIALGTTLSSCGDVSSLASSSSSSLSTSSPSSSLSTSSPDSTSSPNSSSSSSSSNSSSSSDPWIDYGSIELTDTMLDAVSLNNITLRGHMFLGMSSQSTPYGIELKYDTGIFSATYSTMAQDFVTGEEIPTTSTTYYYEGENGNAFTPNSPNINNIASQDTGDSFDSGYYTNPFALFDASDFTINYSYSGPGYQFAFTGLDVNKIITAYTNIASAASGGMYTFYGDTIEGFYIYTDGEQVTGLGVSASSSDPMYEEFGLGLSMSLQIKDLGTTTVDTSSMTSPYSIPEGQEEEYQAFYDALDLLDNYNYHFDVKVTDVLGTTIQESEAYVLEDGWAGVDRYTDSADYYGVHHNSDGTYDYYNGSSSDSLAPQYKAYAAYHHLPSFDFAPEIFTLDTASSTDSVYVFTLREDFIENYGASLVANELTYDAFANTARDLTIEINSDGSFNSFTFNYTESNNTISTFVETFDSFGTLTEIPTSMADFTNYVSMAIPTSWDDPAAVDADDLPLSMWLDMMEGGSDILFPLTSALTPYYMGFYSILGDGTISLQLDLVKETNYDSARELYELACGELSTLLNTELETLDGYLQASATIGSVTYTVGVLTSYVVVIEITSAMVL